MILEALFRFRPLQIVCSAMIMTFSVVSAAEKPAPTVAEKSASGSGKTESRSLFDGKTLTGWISSDFAGRGSVTVSNGQINLGMGSMTGINWTNTNTLPRMSYEISLDAMRVDGSDFFCGLTFPVGKDPCSFIVGGWGGGVVGLSSIDSEDASQNETTGYMNFTNGKWYHIRVRVEPGKIQAWIDNDRVVNLETEGKRISIRMEVEPSVPLGIATWNTAAALKNIQLKRL
jgi:hypothetical protein